MLNLSDWICGIGWFDKEVAAENTAASIKVRLRGLRAYTIWVGAGAARLCMELTGAVRHLVRTVHMCLSPQSILIVADSFYGT